MFGALDFADPSVTRGLGRRDAEGYYGSMRLRPGVFRAGRTTFANADEAVAELFAAYVVDRRSLDPSAAAWIRRCLDESGPEHWRGAAAALRQGEPLSDLDSGAYRCGYCGHRWLEFSGGA